MRNSAKGAVPKLTETRSVVTRTVTSGGGSAASRDQVSVTNTAGTATIPYKLEQTASGPARAETKYDEAGGVLRVTVTAPQLRGRGRDRRTGRRRKREGGVRLELSIDAAGLKVLGVDNAVWPMAGGIKLQYDELIDCMQRHGMLTAADQKRLKAMYTQQVLALIHTGKLLQSSSGPPTPEAESLGRARRSPIAASAVQAWEAEIVDSAKLDKAGGGKDKQKQHLHRVLARGAQGGRRAKTKAKKKTQTEEEDPPWEEELPFEVITPDDPNAKVGPRRRRQGALHHAQQVDAIHGHVRKQTDRECAGARGRGHRPGSTAPSWICRRSRSARCGSVDKDPLAPPGLRAWSGSIDLRPAKPVIVTVDAKLDASGLATWHFKTIDPATQRLPRRPVRRLPACKQRPPPLGEGAVTFTVAQKRNLKTGAKIGNGARIVFDKNESIDTPVFTNTIDRQ